jgi:hypothetical protein
MLKPIRKEGRSPARCKLDGRTVMKAAVGIFLFAGVSLAQLSPSLTQRRALEAAASSPTALVVWSEPVGRLENGETRAAFNAFSVVDPMRPGHQVRGLRVDLAIPNWSGIVYVEEGEIVDLKKCADWLARMARTYPEVQDTFSVGGRATEDPPLAFRFSYRLMGTKPVLSLAGPELRLMEFTGVPSSDLAAIFAGAVRALRRPK